MRLPNPLRHLLKLSRCLDYVIAKPQLQQLRECVERRAWTLRALFPCLDECLQRGSCISSCSSDLRVQLDAVVTSERKRQQRRNIDRWIEAMDENPSQQRRWV